MASFQKRGKTWTAKISYYKDDVREFVTKGGFRTKKEAQYWANENELDISNGSNLKGGKQLFTDYFLNWYETYKKPILAKSSRLRYQYTIGIIMNNFAGKRLDEITRSEYQQFLNEYANPLSVDGKEKKQRSLSSSEKVNVQIRASVRDAVEDGLIKRDFTAHTKISGRPEKPKEMKYLDAGDADKLTRALESDINIAHLTKLMALVSLQTGARFSEVAGLTWDCFSEKFNTLRINKAWDTLGKKDFTDTKNPQSKRVIKITPHMSEILRNYHKLQLIKLEELEIDNPLNLIFLSQIGKVPDDTAANQTLHRVLKKIGAKDITFHGLRHTHASYLIYKGVSIYYISERLGHANYSTTIRVYSHMIREMEKVEAGKTLVALSEMGRSVNKLVNKRAKNG
ncbi:site-specific integrase [Levilactobacillus yiduensis]|uniref:site-specific integrase n=1 Tax=Levilactobacillus yiduensis TaxID=2953880 RepID=UPI0021575C46|nr:site-specific integrase [Levilactobacillus yiduensis]